MTQKFPDRLSLGTSHSTTRYELHVQFDDEEGEDGKSWYVWSNRASLKSVQQLKKRWDAGRIGGYNPGSGSYGLIKGHPCRIVVVSENRRLIGDPAAVKDIPDVPQAIKSAAEQHRHSSFLD
jgi:hypothetical protein